MAAVLRTATTTGLLARPFALAATTPASSSPFPLWSSQPRMFGSTAVSSLASKPFPGSPARSRFDHRLAQLRAWRAPGASPLLRHAQHTLVARDFASSNTPTSNKPGAASKQQQSQDSKQEEEQREPETANSTADSAAATQEELDVNAKNLSIREKVSRFIRRYGFVGVATYFGLYLATLFGLYSAISSGLLKGGDVLSLIKGLGIGGELLDKIDPKAGNFAVAWIAAKFTEPIRLGLTIMLTPWIARIVNPILGPLLAPFVALARAWFRSKSGRP